MWRCPGDAFSSWLFLFSPCSSYLSMSWIFCIWRMFWLQNFLQFICEIRGTQKSFLLFQSFIARQKFDGISSFSWSFSDGLPFHDLFRWNSQLLRSKLAPRQLGLAIQDKILAVSSLFGLPREVWLNINRHWAYSSLDFTFRSSFQINFARPLVKGISKFYYHYPLSWICLSWLHVSLIILVSVRQTGQGLVHE